MLRFASTEHRLPACAVIGAPPDPKAAGETPASRTAETAVLRPNGQRQHESNRDRRGDRRSDMPAKSKKQQMAGGAALAAKRGERSRSSLKGASKQMAKSMSAKQLRDFAKTKRKKLPTKKRKKKS